MGAEITVTLKCEQCNVVSEIYDDWDDYICEECRLKNTDTDVILAMQEAVKRCLIEDEEIKKTEEGVEGWIWIGEHTQKEKEMFIMGAKFGGDQVLFKLCDELNIVAEWEKIHEEFIQKRKKK